MADQQTRDLLTLWGFENLIESFKDQEIDYESMVNLSDSILKEIVPKVGPRIKLMKRISMLTTIAQMDVIIEDREQDTVSERSSTSTISVGQIIDTDGDKENDDPLTSTDIAEAGKTFELATNNTDGNVVFYGREMLENVLCTAYNMDLEKYLMMSGKGKFILSMYKKERALNRKTRNILVELITAALLDQEGKVTGRDFEIMAHKIIKLFPSEKQDTYYIPRSSIKSAYVKNLVTNPKGKLIDKYRNMKRLYKSSNSNSTATTSYTADEVTCTTTKEMVECSQWLKNWSQPWDLVLKNWMKTFPMRRNSIVSTVAKFLEEWPILKQKDSVSLIEYDFTEMFADNSLNLYAHWDSFFDKLNGSKCTLDKEGEELRQHLSLELSECSKRSIQILLLSTLFPPRARVKNLKSTFWKPTIAECQGSIINHVKIAGDIENFVRDRKVKLGQQNRLNQPYMIVLGPSISEISESYFIIDDVIYPTVSVMQCLDLMFKSFHVLSAQYPVESEHIWLLIQTLVYKITTKYDKKIPYVASLINDLQDSQSVA